MKHHTKDKGDIGLTKVIADLTENGFIISLPISEHQQYDLIADYEGKLIRIQIKYRSLSINNKTISFSCKTSHVGLNGKSILRKYEKNDFDLYAIYSPSTKRCYYVPNVGQKHITIAEKQIQSYTKFYWYEDFLNPLIDEMPKKRSGCDFENFNPPVLSILKYGKLKVENRPKFEELKNEIKELGYVGTGRKYGVSDNAVRKWEKKDEKELNNNL